MCDFRRYLATAWHNILGGMDVIDGNWIKARLKGYHGEKKALADALGVHHSIVAKIIHGKRKVSSREIPKVLAFFQMAEETAIPALGPKYEKLVQDIAELEGAELDLIQAAVDGMLARRQRADRE